MNPQQEKLLAERNAELEKELSAKNRALKIEAALEEVRSRSLAMHDSTELKEVVTVVFDKLKELDFLMDEGAAVILVFKAATKDHIQWIADPGQSYSTSFKTPYTDHPISSDVFRAKENGLDFFSKIYPFEEKNDYFKYLFEHSDYQHLPDEVKKMILESKSYGFSVAFAKNSAILIPTNTGRLLSENQKEILKRFVRVFEQSYTRFNDLKKAEAQAREAQIEAALERVRSRSMAMHKSQEVMDVAVTVYDELQRLDFKSGAATIIIMDKDTGYMEHWLAGFIQRNHVESYQVNNIDHPLHAAQLAAWRKGEKFVSIELSGTALKDYAEETFTQTGYKNLPDEEKAMLSAREHTVFNLAYMSHGALMWAPSTLSDENVIILQRFAKVFEQTYTRFLDLQKAEAQAREAQIELGLERVRARAMAMRTSGELNDLIKTIYVELKKLEASLDRCIIMIIDARTKGMTWWMAGGDNALIKDGFYVQFNQHQVYLAYLKAWEEREEKWQYIIEGPEKKNFDDFLFNDTELCKLPPVVIQNMRSFEKIYNSASFGNFGCLLTGSVEPLEEQAFNILVRFTKVFDLTYTRFNDLKQAEAQAKESQIQLAMERVRATTMAMQKSDELAEVATLLFKQVNDLNIKTWTTGFNIWSDDNNAWEDWITNPQGGFIEPYTIDATRFPVFIEVSDAKKRGEEFFVQYVEGELLKQTYRELSKFGDKKQFEKMLEGGFQFPSRQFHHFVFRSKVSLMFITYEPVPEAHDIFKRFGKVFEQTYTRFLDLQRAEAQAREAQIEAALERVRSSAMAMHSSKDLFSVADVLRDQLSHLRKKELESSIIHLYPENAPNFEVWYSYLPLNDPTGELVKDHISVPKDASSWTIEMMRKYHSQDETYTIESKGKMLEDWYHVLEQYAPATVEHDATGKLILPEVLYYHFSKFSGGSLLMISGEEPDEEACRLQLRAAKVFEMAYRRFKDLEKAEAQAREAQIQLALERIRSRSLAMHHSNELKDVVAILFQQLKILQVDFDGGAAIHLFSEDSKDAIILVASPELMSPIQVNLPYDEEAFVNNLIILDVWNAKETGQNIFNRLYSFEEKNKYFEYVFKHNNLEIIPQLSRDFILQADSYTASFIAEKNSLLGANSWSRQLFSENDFDVLKRFARVFEQAYIRFLDLQKAETQAREAQIEAALEKVRSRTMAMQRSDELQEAANLLFQQVKALKIPVWSCGYNIWEKDEKVCTGWMSSEGFLQPPFRIPLTGSPTFIRFYESRKKGESFYVEEVAGEALKAHYEYMLTLPDFAKIAEKHIKAGFPLPEFQINHVVNFTHGNLIFITSEPVPHAWDVFKRFALVFDQTYTRFLDLHRAEANAKEAVKQASIDRVRAEIASMRTTTDLEKITPLVWDELITLQVPFIRCGVFIMDEEKEQIQVYLSTPVGKAIASFQLPYNSKGISQQVLTNWQNNQPYIDHWDAEIFSEWTKSLVAEGAIKSYEKYSAEKPPENLYLHFLPFLQGMLYVGNAAQLKEDEIQLVQSLANSFATAYARYEDFNKLEAAKQQVDNTLKELRSAQQQLIQSEKMASLGELTAGIAHEIQNPLNFVNNFSDVNTELLEELKAELMTGNGQEAIAIADDIKENEQKINHHGKRADAIVKGMLQHSRANTGKKESTNINALADEYLRLSYHGLRAKDKSFNADFKTDFDESIGKIEVIPQDIGRVLLNLYNNAFYAVNEKKKVTSLKGENYEPTVWVTTKGISSPLGAGGLEIVVRDNGIGIPQKAIDKIFQPFFTTKPTGQGTGLGLSLSYDIIKAHGGELKVETKEGEGAEFIIQLHF